MTSLGYRANDYFIVIIPAAPSNLIDKVIEIMRPLLKW